MFHFNPHFPHICEHQPQGLIHKWKRLDLRNNPTAHIYSIEATIISIKVKSIKFPVKSNKWIFMFSLKAFFYCFLWPFMCQNHSPGPFLCKYWWHDFRSWILARKNQFYNWFSEVTRKWRKNYDLFIFQILRIEALLELEIDRQGRF